MLRIKLLLYCWTCCHMAFAQQSYTRATKLMGCRFDFTVVADNKLQGQALIDTAIAEISRIEKVISSWDDFSETSRINKQAGITPVKVSQELFDLIQRSLRISKLTDGAFDISYASMDRIWKYDGSMTAMPSEEAIKLSVAKVGYQYIVLNQVDTSVFLTKTGMKIGFGAIGKGYAADKAKSLLISKGVNAGIINASGDLNAWGKQVNGKDWMIAITNPLDKSKAFSWLPVNNSSVVTSGDYEKYVIFNEKHYSHIIDPRTGYPCEGSRSATIFAPSAELADALATAIFVMGVNVGIDFINQLKGIECIVVDNELKMHTSANIQLRKTTTIETD